MAINLAATFEKFDDEHIKFERIENPLHPRPDICAFLLLDRLCPNPGRDIVCASEHDEFFIDVSAEKLAEVASEDDVLTLVRCGVRFSDEYDCLCMFA